MKTKQILISLSLITSSFLNSCKTAEVDLHVGDFYLNSVDGSGEYYLSKKGKIFPHIRVVNWMLENEALKGNAYLVDEILVADSRLDKSEEKAHIEIFYLSLVEFEASEFITLTRKKPTAEQAAKIGKSRERLNFLLNQEMLLETPKVDPMQLPKKFNFPGKGEATAP